MSKHTDDELLKKLNISDPDLRDMQSKVDQFVKTLNPSQVKSLKKSLPTPEQAVKTIGPDVKPADLETFIRARAPHHAHIVLYNQNGESQD
jgi:hypothetical protein